MGCACVKQASRRGSRAGAKSKASSAKVVVERLDLPSAASAVPSEAAADTAESRKSRGDSQADSAVPNDSKKKDKRGSTRTEGRERLRNIPRQTEGEQVAAGWPPWLSAVAGEAVKGWIPRKADTFEKIDKIGQGTYSNVYKARDLVSGKIVALKKVRFDNLEPDSVRFMAREILVLRRLDHPNVIKLEGLVTSRMSCSLYLVFEYMEHDLAGLAACPDITFTEPQVKCYIHQLLSGLEHCHTRNVLHRDIKGSNLLLDNSGILKIADFGLATFFNPNHRQPLTSRVVTLWYRPPELLLGATEYDVAVDLWSAGCILAELMAGKPILPGRTEVEQLHRIFKLCGSPSEEYWKRLKLPQATVFKFQQPYARCLKETFKDFPDPALSLLDKLLAIEPSDRGTASLALASEFFSAEPHACDPSSLPQYPPSKEMDAKLRDEESRRKRAQDLQVRGETSKRVSHRTTRAIPAPEANAEMQVNIQLRRKQISQQVKSKSEKFPPAHEDGVVGFPMEPLGQSNLSSSLRLSGRHQVPTTMSSLVSQSGPVGNSSGSIGDRVGRRRKKSSLGAGVHGGEDGRPRRPPSRGGHMGTVANSSEFSQSGDFSTMNRTRNLHEGESAYTASRRVSHLKPQVPEDPASARADGL